MDAGRKMQKGMEVRGSAESLRSGTLTPIIALAALALVIERRRKGFGVTSRPRDQTRHTLGSGRVTHLTSSLYPSWSVLFQHSPHTHIPPITVDYGI
jgi:hypothetical protein